MIQNENIDNSGKHNLVLWIYKHKLGIFKKQEGDYYHPAIIKRLKKGRLKIITFNSWSLDLKNRYFFGVCERFSKWIVIRRFEDDGVNLSRKERACFVGI